MGLGAGIFGIYAYWVIVQIAPKEYKELLLENLEEFEQRKYGTTLLIFFERK